MQSNHTKSPNSLLSVGFCVQSTSFVFLTQTTSPSSPPPTSPEANQSPTTDKRIALSIGIIRSPSAVILLSSGQLCCRFPVHWNAIACLCIFGMTCRASQQQLENRPRTTIKRFDISDTPKGGYFYFAFHYTKKFWKLRTVRYIMTVPLSLPPPPPSLSVSRPLKIHNQWGWKIRVKINHWQPQICHSYHVLRTVIYNWERERGGRGVFYLTALSNAKIVQQWWQTNGIYVGSISGMISTDWLTD